MSSYTKLEQPAHKMLIYCGLVNLQGEEITFPDYARCEVSVAPRTQFRAKFGCEEADWGWVAGLILCGQEEPTPELTAPRLWFDQPVMMKRDMVFFVNCKLNDVGYEIARRAIIPFSLIGVGKEEIATYG